VEDRGGAGLVLFVAARSAFYWIPHPIRLCAFRDLYAGKRALILALDAGFLLRVIRIDGVQG
jgi:hypothetical protein